MVLEPDPELLESPSDSSELLLLLALKREDLSSAIGWAPDRSPKPGEVRDKR